MARADANEYEHLEDLLSDFGAPGHPNAEEGTRLIEARYLGLASLVEVQGVEQAERVRALGPDDYIFTYFNKEGEILPLTN